MDSLLTTEEVVLLRHDEDKIDRELEKLMSMDSTRIFSSRSFDLTNSFNSDNELCAKFENVAITPEVMRAWRLRSYDASPANAIKDVLSLDAAVPVPKPGAGELLVQVSHAAINPIDWKLFAGPTPLFKASVPYTPGFDFQGVVVGKGSEDIDVDVGESVIGYLGLTETCPVDDNLVPKSGSAGAFAEYCVVPASRVAIIPGSSDPRAMAGLPLAGLTAYQALFTGAGKSLQGTPLGDVKEGDKVLILGGSSGTGNFAVQLAKARGARVAATASTSLMPKGDKTKSDWVRELGADVVIDYNKEDWGRRLAGQNYDLIFDCVGDEKDVAKASKVLKRGGAFISIANFDLPAGGSSCRFNNMIVTADGEDLSELVTLTEQGKLTVFLDASFAFDRLLQALERSMTARATGKIIVDL